MPTAPPAPGEAQAAAPVVVAMVTHQAGPWFDEALASLAAQDYPNLSVLVIDAASGSDDTLSRVAAVLPAAYVRRLDDNPGFGPAANEVLEVVDGAAFFVFCHDDVALDPDAISNLVEEAYRSNAGVVGPKLVSWGSPRELLQVGMSADKTGVLSPLVERGELDQEQHDGVRDVFAVPGGCTVVRADLFSALGGFDPAITFLGEDLDLCWRAQIAGARVLIVPSARAQHREALPARRPLDDRRRLLARHRLRSVLTCYGAFHLVRVLPQVAVVSMVEAIFALVTRDRAHARDVLGAWSWNFANRRDLRVRRRLVRRTRQLPDREVRRLQVRGSARLMSFARGDLGRDRVRSSLADVGQGLSGIFAPGPRRLAAGAAVAVSMVMIFGSRGLFGTTLPDIGGLAGFDDGPVDLARQYLSGWRSTGLGAEAAAPTGIALLALLGGVTLGNMDLLQVLLVLGALPVGAFGAWRLAGMLGSARAQAVGLITYAVVPLPYVALGVGDWAGLVAYALWPWIFACLVLATGDAPSEEVGPSSSRATLGLGALLALGAALVPAMALVLVVAGLGLAVGALVTGSARVAVRSLRACGVAIAIAVVAHLPWALDAALPGADWWMVGGIAPLGHADVGVGELARFGADANGSGLLAFGLLVVAGFALVIGRGWRLTWALRCWFVALASWTVAWAGGEGLLGIEVPPFTVTVAPAAVALSFSAALGVVAFERDLREYRFGVPQLASVVAVAGLALGSLPVLSGAIDGRWGLPEADLVTPISSLVGDPDAASRNIRVLWIGDPAVLPIGGFRLADNLAYGVSRGGVPGVSARFAESPLGATELLTDAIRLAADGRTDRLGRLLAPFGIGYVVVVERAAPDRFSTPRHPAPEGLIATLARQLDMRRVEVDDAVVVYENAAAAPVRWSAPGPMVTDALDEGELFPVVAGLDLSGVDPVLARRASHARWVGEVPPGRLYVAEAASSRWSLEVDGQAVPRQRAFGWANHFDVGQDGGDGVLSFSTSPLRWLLISVQVLAWLILGRGLIRRRADRRVA